MSRLTTAVLATGVFAGVFCVGMWGDRLPGLLAPAKAEAKVESRPTRSMTAEEFGAQYGSNEEGIAGVVGQMTGKPVSPEQARAAANDAPASDRIARFARFERDGVTFTCFSHRNDGEVDHVILKSGPDSFTKDDATLAQWTNSGCAEAIGPGGSNISLTQVAVKALEVVPRTPAFASTRREIMASMTQPRGG